MLPILDSDQLHEIDRLTVEQREITSFQLMQEAATACFAKMQIPGVKENGSPLPVVIFCGRGNNGGDGYVIARLLQEQGNPVEIVDIPLGKMSGDCLKASLLAHESNLSVSELIRNDEFPEIAPEALVIDAVFGTGLNRPVTGGLAELFDQLNNHLLKVGGFNKVTTKVVFHRYLIILPR